MDVVIFIISIILYFRGYKSWGVLGLLALLTSLFGFALNSSDFIHEHNITDLAIVLNLIFFSHERIRGKWVVDLKLKRIVYVFFAYLLLAAFVDYNINGTAIYDIIRSAKPWLFLLSFFTFSRLSYYQLRNIFKILIVITLIQVAMYYIQYFTGISLYHQKFIGASYDFEGKDMQRGTLPPAFALLVLFILVSTFSFLRNYWLSWLFAIILLVGTFILSLTRSVLIAFFIGSVIIYSINKVKIGIKLILQYAFISFIFLALMYQVKPLQDRFNEGLKDIDYTMENTYKTGDVNGDFSFRIFQFEERADYLLHSPQYTIFGLGFIHESSMNKQIFSIGQPSINEKGEQTHLGVSQLDTADFAWSLLMIRLGLLGIFFLMLFFVFFLRYFYSHRRYIISRVAFTYLLLNLFLLSLFSSNIADGTFWPVFFLLFYYQSKEIMNQKMINEPQAPRNHSNSLV